MVGGEVHDYDIISHARFQSFSNSFKHKAMKWDESKIKDFVYIINDAVICEGLRNSDWLMDGLTASKVVIQEVDGEGEDVDKQPLGSQGKDLVWVCLTQST